MTPQCVAKMLATLMRRASVEAGDLRDRGEALVGGELHVHAVAELGGKHAGKFAGVLAVLRTSQKEKRLTGDPIADAAVPLKFLAISDLANRT